MIHLISMHTSISPTVFLKKSEKLLSLVNELDRAIKNSTSDTTRLTPAIQELVKSLLFNTALLNENEFEATIDLKEIRNEVILITHLSTSLLPTMSKMNFTALSLAKKVYWKAECMMKGNFIIIPQTLHSVINSFLGISGLSTLSQVSHTYKTWAYKDNFWKNEANRIGLSDKEIHNAGGYREAIGVSHMHFYTALYKCISKSSERAKESNSATQVDLADKKALSHPESIRRFKRHLQSQRSEMENVREIILNNANLKAIPGWVWKFFPKLHSLNLAQNRIRTLPIEIFRMNLISLNCAFNQLNQLPVLSFSSVNRLQKLDLSNNPLTALPDSIAQVRLNFILCISENSSLSREIALLKKLRDDLKIHEISNNTPYKLIKTAPNTNTPLAFLEEID